MGYIFELLKLRRIDKYKYLNLKSSYSEIYNMIWRSSCKTIAMNESMIKKCTEMKFYESFLFNQFINSYAYALINWIKANEEIYIDINIHNVLSFLFSLQENVLNDLYKKFPEYKTVEKYIDVEKVLMDFNFSIADEIYSQKISFWRFLRRKCV